MKSFLKNIYYFEIKNRLTMVAGCAFFNIFVLVLNKNNLVTFVLKPAKFTVFTQTDTYFIFQEASEVFVFYVSVIGFFTSQLIFVSAVTNFVSFLSPIFKPRENQGIKKVFFSLISIWMVLPVITLFLLLPTSFNFFLSLTENHNFFSAYDFFFEANVLSYWFFCKALYQNSQLFLFLVAGVFITFYDRVELSSIKKTRKLSYLILWVFVAIFLPQEITIQILIFSIGALAYELFVFNLAKSAQKLKK